MREEASLEQSYVDGGRDGVRVPREAGPARAFASSPLRRMGSLDMFRRRSLDFLASIADLRLVCLIVCLSGLSESRSKKVCVSVCVSVCVCECV